MKKKLLIILSLVAVMALCAASLIACSGLATEQLDNLHKELQRNHRNDSAESSISFWVEGKVSYLDDSGKEIAANVLWTIEGTTKVTVGTETNAMGQVQIIVPDEVEEPINYTLIGTLVDANGKAYKNKDGEAYKVEIAKTVPAGKGHGTESSPYSVAGVLAEYATLADGNYSTEMVYVTGIIVTTLTDKGNGAYAFDIADNKGDTSTLNAWFCYPGSITINENDKVTIHGYIEKYNGKLEITTNAAHAASTCVVTNCVPGVSTITADTIEGVTINLSKTSGTNGEQFTFTVETAKNIAAVTVNSVAVTAVEGVYTGTIAGNTVVSVSIAPDAASVKFDFQTSITVAGQGEYSADQALAALNAAAGGTETGLVSVTASKVYAGNGSGGAKPNALGMIKFGTGSANGTLTLTFADSVRINKVEIKCHDFNSMSDQYPTTTSSVSVNGVSKANPYNTSATPETLTFEFDASNVITIATSNTAANKGGRLCIYEIVVYYAQ